MYTIEDRAKECLWNTWDSKWDASVFCEFLLASLPAVTKALTEQKAIDIYKACEWLRARNVLTEDSLKDFIKVMEEEK